jgi:hypothetical protein
LLHPIRHWSRAGDHFLRHRQPGFGPDLASALNREGLLPLLVLPVAATMLDPIFRIRGSIASAVLDSLWFLALRGPAQIALVTAERVSGRRCERVCCCCPTFSVRPSPPSASRAVGWLGYRAMLGGLLPIGSVAAVVIATAGVHPTLVVASCFALGASAMSAPALAAGLTARSACAERAHGRCARRSTAGAAHRSGAGLRHGWRCLRPRRNVHDADRDRRPLRSCRPRRLGNLCRGP